MKTSTRPIPTGLHATFKLGIDAQAKRFCVGRHFDGATPQTVQKRSGRESNHKEERDLRTDFWQTD